MLRPMALVRTGVSEERSASIIKMTRISELGTMLVVTSNRHMLRRLLVTAYVPGSPILVTLMIEAPYSSEMLVLRRATWCNISEDGIFLHNCFLLLEGK
jgi:hypothetical protein